LRYNSGPKVGVAGVYNAAEYLPEKRDALEQWAAHFMDLPSVSKATPSENSGEVDSQLASGTGV